MGINVSFKGDGRNCLYFSACRQLCYWFLWIYVIAWRNFDEINWYGVSAVIFKDIFHFLYQSNIIKGICCVIGLLCFLLLVAFMFGAMVTAIDGNFVATMELLFNAMVCCVIFWYCGKWVV